VAQIDLSITEGDHSVNALIDSFTFMAQQIEQIRVASQGVLDVDPDRVEAQHAHALLNTQADELAAKMQQAVVAFQFYDKLSQRLNHVSRGLSGLAEIVSHHMCVKDQQAWQEFKQQIRSGTTMREEEELFELIGSVCCRVCKPLTLLRKKTSLSFSKQAQRFFSKKISLIAYLSLSSHKKNHVL
jgi:hypothetical protein